MISHETLPLGVVNPPVKPGGTETTVTAAGGVVARVVGAAEVVVGGGAAVGPGRPPVEQPATTRAASPAARARTRRIVGRATPQDSDFGSFCLSVSTGANRSPTSSTRFSASCASNVIDAVSSVAAQWATSSHVTGIDTVGRDFARRL